MSAGSFDKFAWLKVLQSDPRYTDREQRFGSIVCVQFARRDGTGWAVNLDDMAAKMPGGMSRSAMKTAFGKFVRDGYLTETGKSLGGRGVKARRSHDLTKPAPVGVQVSDETRPRTDTGLDETRPRTEQNPTTYVAKPDHVRGAKTSSELAEEPPKGTSKGTPEGTDARASADEPNVSANPEPPQEISEQQPELPEVEPDPYCADHMPDGTTEKCGPCGTARKNRNDWRERQDKATRDRDEIIRLCRLCDDRGYIGLRAGPFINCPHDRKAIEALEREALEALERQEKQEIDA